MRDFGEVLFWNFLKLIISNTKILVFNLKNAEMYGMVDLWYGIQ